MQPLPRATPAIVTQAAAQCLPRWVLPVLCLVYVLAGFVGRAPWKSADVAALGVMSSLAKGLGNGWQPSLLGHPPDLPALLPYWLGAGALMWGPDHTDWVVRLPFMAAMLASFYFTWHATFRFALLPAAQPVAFAFGGQASTVDYARSLADGALLALMACLGLAQLSHETTPSVFQLLGLTAALRAMADFATAQPTTWRTSVHWLAGLVVLTLSGAPHLAAAVSVIPVGCRGTSLGTRGRVQPAQATLWLVGAVLSVALWVWGGSRLLSFETMGATRWLGQLQTQPKLWLWFTWPVWPFALWTLWRWRSHWRSPHLAAPAVLLLVLMAISLWAEPPERTLLLALPVLAVLAAFALPTLKRSMAALVDWFSVLFFSLGAVVVWVVWLAMLTGFPAKPAANVARLAPGFVLEFSLPAVLTATVATLCWAWVVWWRVSRHPSAMWKSLVLPAGGSVLCWLLLMTLWLPVLDFGRSYEQLARKLSQAVPPGDCVEVHRLTQAQVAGLQHHTPLHIERHPSARQCGTVVIAPEHAQSWVDSQGPHLWAYVGRFSRLTDNKESVLVYRRNDPTAPMAGPANGSN